MAKKVTGSVLVVGGGIAGMQSALDLANSGYYVHLLEKSPSIGGVMAQLDKTFPTNDCAMWIISPTLVEVGRNLNIELHTCSKIEEINGDKGNFKVKIRKMPRYVDFEKCTGCGECATVQIDENYPPKEVDGRLWIDRIKIDEDKCIHCGDCVRACMDENPENHALTSIVQKRFEAIRDEKVIKQPTLLQEILGMTQQERKVFWQDQFKKCIKCYGCIDMCPVYEEEPDGLDLSKWVEKGQVPPPFPLFHLLRAYHVWDTCVLCGECESTCPAQIPLKTIQDFVRYLPPEKVFEVIPGLEDEARNEILNLVERRKTSSRRITYEV